jgi:hypothetical protein
MHSFLQERLAAATDEPSKLGSTEIFVGAVVVGAAYGRNRPATKGNRG